MQAQNCRRTREALVSCAHEGGQLCYARGSH